MQPQVIYVQQPPQKKKTSVAAWLGLGLVLLVGMCAIPTAVIMAGGRTSSSAASPASSKGINEDKCKHERKYKCKIDCVESSEPSGRSSCEMECMNRPLSHWDGKIPECTPGL